jgi:hypothetical protein
VLGAGALIVAGWLAVQAFAARQTNASLGGPVNLHTGQYAAGAIAAGAIGIILLTVSIVQMRRYEEVEDRIADPVCNYCHQPRSEHAGPDRSVCPQYPAH